MKYIADLHTHSKYSRATSKESCLEGYYQWSRIKGIHVVGTGDFTHPGWFGEIRDKLKEDGSGFLRLVDMPKTSGLEGASPAETDVRYVLSAEISCIYKRAGRTRKVHHLLLAPDLAAAGRIGVKLGSLGNITSDGRPILGLDSRDLLDIVLSASERACLIPAHIWTPWFSLFGSKSGFDTMEECFGDLTSHIFALETGLSSDPEMNWRWSRLDRYSLVSNSDSHSPQKLGREANRFDTDLTYDAMITALRTGQGNLGTIEFFPEEGKYHLDGHRQCGVCLEPEETTAKNDLCPVCGKALTIGVLHRVAELADRPKGRRPASAPDFCYLIPLAEVLGEIMGTGSGSKRVVDSYAKAISLFGSEFSLLLEAPPEEIRRKAGEVLGEAIDRMRTRRVHPQSGYDGEFGIIKVFSPGEAAQFMGQAHLFGSADSLLRRTPKIVSGPAKKDPNRIPTTRAATPSISELNPEQCSVLDCDAPTVLVTAGPGTGKTRTLVSWIASQIAENRARPDQIMAVTFTNKAAEEMLSRLKTLTGEKASGIRIGTFHSLCYRILVSEAGHEITLYDEARRRRALAMLFPEKKPFHIARLSKEAETAFEQRGPRSAEVAAYGRHLDECGAIDLSELIGRTNDLFSADKKVLDRYRESLRFLCVDELQDINPAQYEFLRILASGQESGKPAAAGTGIRILAIGDPDQAIYGFRGSDPKLFNAFGRDFQATRISLACNYRSSAEILNSAQALIAANPLSERVVLRPMRHAGIPLSILAAPNAVSEADFIVSRITEIIGGTSHRSVQSGEKASAHSFGDIAVLFRLKEIAGPLVQAFTRAGIPFRFGDATPFFSTPPFSALADALRLHLNPKDPIALVSLLSGLAQRPVSEVSKALDARPSLAKAQKSESPLKEAAERIMAFLEGSAKAAQTAELVSLAMDQFVTGADLDFEGQSKRDLLLEASRSFRGNISEFLAEFILDPYTDSARYRTEAVSFLTFHAAKGLEFPVVFIAGAEEGVTPLLGRDSSIEEERRLFYVAMTRACDELYIASAGLRVRHGRAEPAAPSRFLSEIPEQWKICVRAKTPKKRTTESEQLSLF